VVWSRQLVHHDIWNLDANAPPTLIDVERDEKTTPALVETTKQGFLFVLNRETGEPIYPIEERPAPKSDFRVKRPRRPSPMWRRQLRPFRTNGLVYFRSPIGSVWAVVAGSQEVAL
jgi:glucose dehydrogenase